MLEGIITKGLSGTYVVETEEGEFICKPRGLFRLKGISPLIGDKVQIKITDEADREGQILTIHKRKNELVRPKVANIEQTCIVFSAVDPVPDFLLIDKIILSAFELDLDVILCENKNDLGHGHSLDVILNEYELAGIKLVKVSAESNMNMENLYEYLRDRITVFAGQSGVGKSSIINRILQDRKMETGDLSAKNKKGKHTTRHAELIELKDGGFIIDTPGFSNFDIEKITYDELIEFYPEFNNITGKCRFKGCIHVNEPGCAVKQAVDDGQIGKGRYDRYVYFYDLLKEKDDNKYK